MARVKAGSVEQRSEIWAKKSNMRRREKRILDN